MIRVLFWLIARIFCCWQLALEVYVKPQRCRNRPFGKLGFMRIFLQPIWFEHLEVKAEAWGTPVIYVRLKPPCAWLVGKSYIRWYISYKISISDWLYKILIIYTPKMSSRNDRPNWKRAEAVTLRFFSMRFFSLGQIPNNHIVFVIQ